MSVMNPPKNQTPVPFSPSGRRSLLGLMLALAGCLLALLPYRAVSGDVASSAVLQFVEPADGAIFSTLDEIPVVLRAFAPDDVFLGGEVFANNNKIASVFYCCPLCPCAPPTEGMETTLRIPAPLNGNTPPPQPWQGWRTKSARAYRLTARATGQNGTVLEAAPITITVLDLTMHMSLDADGSVRLVLPQGSMVAGGFDLHASEDLATWTRLGPFSPGAVAAFYFDPPPENARRRRFYRAVFVPPDGT